jgi:ceramide glucosyltransferase
MTPVVVSQALLACCLASLAYAAFTIVRVAIFRMPDRPPPGFAPPVTILKPLRGLEASLEDCLRSFCDQDYSDFQVVFGVEDELDAAVPVVRRLIAEYSERDLSLVVNDRLVGPNRKASNLANMQSAAKHDILVVADSDVRVTPDYLRSVVAPFAEPGVGAATCLYKAMPLGGLSSVLGAMFINDWFLPSVVAMLAFEKLRFCFGATMAVRRDTLESVGGFSALAPYLADDYMLGQLVSARGQAVRLAPFVVVNVVHEPDTATLFRHELRWARTVRTVRPVGFALSFLTDTLPLTLLYAAAAPGAPLAPALLGAALLLRAGIDAVVRRRFAVPGPYRPWLVPVRDLLSCVVRIGSFLGREVEWRTQEFSVNPSGRLSVKKRDTP